MASREHPPQGPFTAGPSDPQRHGKGQNLTRTLRIGSGGGGRDCTQDTLHLLYDFHHLTDLSTKFMSLYDTLGNSPLT